MATTTSQYYNIIISSGSPMSSSQISFPNYQFTYVDLKNVEIQEWQDDYSDSSYVTGNYEVLRKRMYGKSQLIWLHHINDKQDDSVPVSQIIGCDTLPDLTGTNADCKFNNGDLYQYGKLPCGLVTNNGTLIPQILVPSESYSGINNGLITPQGSANVAKIGSKGYNWSAINISSCDNTTYLGTNASKVITTNPLIYGQKNYQKYITNKNSIAFGVDDYAIANRYYDCNLTSSFKSFAFCYNIGDFTPVGRGKDATQKNLTPQLILDINGSGVHQGQTNVDDYTEQNIINYPTNTIIQINANGSILVKVNKLQKQGAFSAPENDYLPPQCKKKQRGYLNKPLFIYPIYNGVVVTNSCIKNKDGNQQIFVNFPLNGDIMKNIVISGVVKDDYISSMIEKESQSQMKFFPALIQQCENNSDFEKVNLKIKGKDVFSVGSKVSIKWKKSVGNFAVCPIFFHRDLYFSLFFKGQYVPTSQLTEAITDDNNQQTVYQVYSMGYYFYPIVNYFLCGSSCWISGINSSSGNVSCVYVPGPGYSEDGTYLKQGKNGLICIDDDLQQAIYRADFRFVASKPLEYPIQVFGMALATSRGEFQFKTSSANGSFVICSSGSTSMTIISQYSSALIQQTYLATTNSANWLGLMTNLSITANADGVNGKMTLDGYPVSQGIDIIKQYQSVGQIDLDMLFVNSDCTAINNYDLSRNPNSAIFKGFAMEIANNNSQNNNAIQINLYGSQRKMSDMKLICAPFWDGDRLQQVLAYFQKYMQLKLRLLNYVDTVTTINSGHYIDSTCLYSKSGNSKWKAKIVNSVMDGAKKIKSQFFRIPSSVNWQSPILDFTTGTPCLEALNVIAEKTGCKFVVGLDGIGYFYEMNKYGLPYIVENQINKSNQIVNFKSSQIISINISPYIQNKYNSIATFGFLQTNQTNNENNQKFMAQSVIMGSYHTNLDPEQDSQLVGDLAFPWARNMVGVQRGFFTKQELYNLHENRIVASVADTYQGNITVVGNTKVYFVWQVIDINGIPFMVESIDHNIDLQTKTWTTSYQITYIDVNRLQNNKSTYKNK